MFYQTYTLPNGIRLVHKPDDSPVAYCGMAINTGTRDEAESEQGMAHFIEYILDGRIIYRPDAVDKPVPGIKIKFNAGNPRPVLPPVVLFLHEQVQFVQAVESCSIFGQVEFKRFKEADHGDAAFMVDGIAHYNCLIRLQRYELLTIAV